MSELTREQETAEAEACNGDIEKLRALGALGNITALFLLRTLEQRIESRRLYVRQHAPTILAGYLTQNPQGVSDGDIRDAAIRAAGLLFDETESP